MDINQKIQNRFGSSCETGKSIEESKTLRVILTRRNHRKFKHDSVEKGLLDTLYGWSENRTRQYLRSAGAGFGQYIRRQGFDLS